MDKSAQVKRALVEALGITPNLAITATVMSIENDTCTVKLLSELVLSDVRLKATISDDEDSFLVVPKVGSEVILMSQTGVLSSLMVIKVDAVEVIRLKRADFEFEYNGTTKKVTLKNATANVGVLVVSLIDTMINAQIVTPSGPGTISPTTIAQLNQIKLLFKNILNAD